MNVNDLARPEIVAMKPYSSARLEAPGLGILLNANESPWSLLDEVTASLSINRYPEPQPAALVEELAKLYAVAPERVLVTRGSDEGIDLLTRVFCRAGQDAILHCPPTFGMYRVAAQAQGAAIVEVRRSAEAGFALNGEQLLAKLHSSSRSFRSWPLMPGLLRSPSSSSSGSPFSAPAHSSRREPRWMDRWLAPPG